MESLEKLMLCRPQYKRKDIQIQLPMTPQITIDRIKINVVHHLKTRSLIPALISDRSHQNRKQFLLSPPSDIQAFNFKNRIADSTSNQRLSNNIQRYKDVNENVTNAFNKISDFNKKDQILIGLKSLEGANERILLIDKILQRKEEMELANLKFKIKKLEPLFKILLKKLKKIRSKKVNQVTKTMSVVPEYGLKTSQVSPVGEKILPNFSNQPALLWFSQRPGTIKDEDEKQSPKTRAQKNRQATQLKMMSNNQDIRTGIMSKVSESSEQMIKFGQLKFEQSSMKRQKNLKIRIHQVKSKINSKIQPKIRNIVNSSNMPQA